MHVNMHFILLYTQGQNRSLYSFNLFFQYFWCLKYLNFYFYLSFKPVFEFYVSIILYRIQVFLMQIFCATHSLLYFLWLPKKPDNVVNNYITDNSISYNGTLKNLPVKWACWILWLICLSEAFSTVAFHPWNVLSPLLYFQSHFVFFNLTRCFQHFFKKLKDDFKLMVGCIVILCPNFPKTVI